MIVNGLSSVIGQIVLDHVEEESELRHEKSLETHNMVDGNVKENPKCMNHVMLINAKVYIKFPFISIDLHFIFCYTFRLYQHSFIPY